jgi:hypothetical protein
VKRGEHSAYRYDFRRLDHGEVIRGVLVRYGAENVPVRAGDPPPAVEWCETPYACSCPEVVRRCPIFVSGMRQRLGDRESTVIRTGTPPLTRLGLWWASPLDPPKFRGFSVGCSRRAPGAEIGCGRWWPRALSVDPDGRQRGDVRDGTGRCPASRCVSCRVPPGSRRCNPLYAR